MSTTPVFLPSGPSESAAFSDPSQSQGDADPLVTTLEALQGNEHDAAKWLETALAFRSAGQPVQAIDACEACLRLDPKQLEGWFLIAELATAVGHREMADDAYDVARQLAPADSRLPSRSS